MVHRDIKPSNLLVQPPAGRDSLEGGTIKLVDFGLALLPSAEGDDHLTPDRHIVLGTPDYLSPEQARDIQAVDIRSDLYSLGCTFYYLLAGQVPFPGGSPLDKLTRHANDQPVPVEELRPVVPPGVAAIVRRLMAKSPDDRFRTPEELADALTRFSELHPVTWTAKPQHPLSLSATEDPAGSDDPSDPSVGSTLGVAVSGTLSLAEFATALDTTERAAIRDALPDLDPEPAISLRARFLLAILFGFMLGVALIVAAAFVR
jgi:serine/threonine-protein kinase